MNDEKCNNGNIKVRWFYLIAGTITATAGFLFWVQSKLDAKADLKSVEIVCIKQEEYNKDMRDVRERLIRIEEAIKGR